LSFVTQVKAFAAGHLKPSQVKHSDPSTTAGHRTTKPDAASSVVALSEHGTNTTVPPIEGLAIYPPTKAEVKAIAVHVNSKIGSKHGRPGNEVLSGAFSAQPSPSEPRERFASVIEKALNHTIGGVRGVYNKAEYAEQRRKMLQWSSDFVEGILNESNVFVGNFGVTA
jgi:hypothetical protein